MGGDGELVQLFEKAHKAAERASNEEAAGGPDEARCIDAIKAMHAYPVTTAVLVSTKVGKRLRNLTKHSQPRIQLAATELLEVWKRLVATEAKNGYILAPDMGSSKAVAAVKVEKVVAVKMETKAKIEPHRPETVKAPLPVAPAKLANTPKTNDTSRDKIREMLVESLAKVSSEANEDDAEKTSFFDPIRVAVSVETVLFQNLGLSTGVNKLKYRSIMFNIRDSNNPDLRRRVLFGDVRPDQLVNMTAEQMASDQRKAQNQQIKEKALFECERGTNRTASTDQFKCGKCKQRKCTYYQMQTRSADEPMTTFVTCINCNNRWKFC